MRAQCQRTWADCCGLLMIRAETLSPWSLLDWSCVPLIVTLVPFDDNARGSGSGSVREASDFKRSVHCQWEAVVKPGLLESPEAASPQIPFCPSRPLG